MNELISLNLNVPPDLAQEIALREDAIIYLKLSLIKTKDALELLLAIMRDEKGALGDWITESMPTLLAAFGEDFQNFWMT